MHFSFGPKNYMATPCLGWKTKAGYVSYEKKKRRMKNGWEATKCDMQCKKHGKKSKYQN